MNQESPVKNNQDEFALIEMINKISNPEENTKHIAGNQCKKLTSAKKRTEKQVNGDIQAALKSIASNSKQS